MQASSSLRNLAWEIAHAEKEYDIRDGQNRDYLERLYTQRDALGSEDRIILDRLVREERVYANFDPTADDWLELDCEIRKVPCARFDFSEADSQTPMLKVRRLTPFAWFCLGWFGFYIAMAIAQLGEGR